MGKGVFQQDKILGISGRVIQHLKVGFGIAFVSAQCGSTSTCLVSVLVFCFS